MTKYPLRPDLKMLIYATLPVAVTQPKYNYSVHIFYTMLLMHWVTTQISPTTVFVQNGYLFPGTGVIPPNFLNQISILAYNLCHAIRDCYSCLPSSKQDAHFFFIKLPMGMIISSVKVVKVELE